MTERQCDGCTLCCKLMPVPAFDNPADQWCPKCRIGQGCGIYDSRPNDCKAFACQWLLGAVPEFLKPDAVRAVIYTAEEGKRLIIHLDRDRSIHPNLAAYLELLNKNKIEYILASNSKTILVTPSNL